MKLTRWYLEPKALSGNFTQTVFADEFEAPALKSEWEWVNPKGNSSYRLSSKANGLEMFAASGSTLNPNQSRFDGPRLLQEISGDFAVEGVIKSASDDPDRSGQALPAIGGLLVWKDQGNYIRFERGMHGKDKISLSGNVDGKYDCFGRGMLASEALYLRLERIGDRISAYCSSDGENWLTCGEVNFPTEDPIQVGIHAIGRGGRRGEDMNTATRFEHFRMLRKP